MPIAVYTGKNPTYNVRKPWVISFDRHVPTFAPKAAWLHFPPGEFELYNPSKVYEPARPVKPIVLRFPTSPTIAVQSVEVVKQTRRLYPLNPIIVQTDSEYAFLYPKDVEVRPVMKAVEAQQAYRYWFFSPKQYNHLFSLINVQRHAPLEAPSDPAVARAMTDWFARQGRLSDKPYTGGLSFEHLCLMAMDAIVDWTDRGEKYETSQWERTPTDGSLVLIKGGIEMGSTWVELGDRLEDELKAWKGLPGHRVINGYSKSRFKEDSKAIQSARLVVSCGDSPLNYVAAYSAVPTLAFYANSARARVDTAQCARFDTFDWALIGAGEVEDVVAYIKRRYDEVGREATSSRRVDQGAGQTGAGVETPGRQEASSQGRPKRVPVPGGRRKRQRTPEDRDSDSGPSDEGDTDS